MFQTSSWTSLVLKITHQAQAQLKMSQLGEAKLATKGVCLGAPQCALHPNSTRGVGLGVSPRWAA